MALPRSLCLDRIVQMKSRDPPSRWPSCRVPCPPLPRVGLACYFSRVSRVGPVLPTPAPGAS